MTDSVNRSSFGNGDGDIIDITSGEAHISEKQPETEQCPQDAFRALGFYVYGTSGPEGSQTHYGTFGPNGQQPMHGPPPFWYNDLVARAERQERSETIRRRRNYWRTPLLLYLITIITTYYAGVGQFGDKGYLFALGVMTILTFHEMGHFVQTKRYKVQSSLPFFIPMPFGPFGTMGAIIRMDGRIPNIKALFDIGISGPLAGLVPTLIFCWIGISLSHIGPKIYGEGVIEFGSPLLFHWIEYFHYGLIPKDTTLYLHPIAFAGWVGLFITSLNLMPLGQLDGGHIFYGLFGRRAGVYSTLFFYLLIALVFAFGLYFWILMLIIIAMMGTRHPPTQDDSQDIGFFRRTLGFLTLAFVLVGFTPIPVQENLTPPDGPNKGFYASNVGTER